MLECVVFTFHIFILCLGLSLSLLSGACCFQERRIGPVQGHGPKPSSEPYTFFLGFSHIIIRKKQRSSQTPDCCSLVLSSSLDKGFIGLCSGLGLYKRSIRELTYGIF